MASAIGRFTLDTFRTYGTALSNTKTVKDAAKVVNGLIQAGILNNAQLKDSAPKVIGAIDFLEFGESLAYVAKWIDSDFIPKRGEKSPSEEPLKNNLAQLSLFVTRFFGFLKASDTYQLITKSDWRALGESIPFVRDHLEKFPAFDTVSGAFFIPFGGVTLYDNTVQGIDGYKKIVDANAKIKKWTQVNSVSPKVIAASQARINLKVEKHDVKKKIANAQLLKSVLGGTSTTFKLAAASTAVVAALVFGGVAGVLTALVFLGLAGNMLSLSKNFVEAYQDKYSRIHNDAAVRLLSRAAAAA